MPRSCLPVATPLQTRLPVATATRASFQSQPQLTSPTAAPAFSPAAATAHTPAAARNSAPRTQRPHTPLRSAAWLRGNLLLGALLLSACTTATLPDASPQGPDSTGAAGVPATRPATSLPSGPQPGSPAATPDRTRPASTASTSPAGADATAITPAPATPAPATDVPAGTPTEGLALTLLHINDHHSHLDPIPRTLQLAGADGQRTPVAVELGGFARVVTAMRTLAEQQPNVIRLHAGDALSGSLYTLRAGALGAADAAMMNTVCFDTFTLGNHEFDKGDAALKGFLDELRAGPCRTAVLSANIAFAPGSALNSRRAPGWVQKSVVLERGGQRIGVIGLTIAAKTMASSSPDKGTRLTDERRAAQQEIDRLRRQGIRHIILASHIGYGLDLELARQLKGVDVIIGGDSHTLLGPQALTTYGVGSPQGPYPTQVRQPDGHTVCVAQAAEYGQVVGRLSVHFDPQGRVTACTGTPFILVGDRFPNRKDGTPPTLEQRTRWQADMAASGVLLPTAEDPQALAVLAPFRDRIDTFRKTVVGIAPEPLCSRRVPGGEGSVDYSRSSAACNAEGRVNRHGGDIQQRVAQAYLDIGNRDYGGADIALQSGGGVRIPLTGAFTAAQVIEVVPFGNPLWRLQVTGAEVRAMIEDGLHATFGPKGSTGPYPYTAGLRFAVDSGAELGQRASRLEVWSRPRQRWEPLDAKRTYRLMVLSFNARGGDGYTTLAKVPAQRRLDIGVLDADVLQAAIDAQPRDEQGRPILRRVPDDWISTQSFR